MIRYEKLSWPQIGKITREDRVVVIPVATLEDHGRHLPIDADAFIVSEVCRRACERIPSDVVLFPTVTHGYSPHHKDFPGSINIRWNVFVEYLCDITESLVHHGFRRMLLVNGHGSNIPLVNIAARLTILEHPESLCASTFYLSGEKGRRAIKKIRESEYPGGICHACELETSIYLHLAPELVNMREAKKDMSFPKSPYVWLDWEDGPVSMMEYWSTLSKTGTMGDPSKATARKGKILLETAAEEIADFALDLKKRKIRKRVDHH
jgi:creatinine amidohydrolase